jgi:hypothetical protein
LLYKVLHLRHLRLLGQLLLCRDLRRQLPYCTLTTNYHHRQALPPLPTALHA